MKVKDLIKTLQKYPEDDKVVFSTDGYFCKRNINYNAKLLLGHLLEPLSEAAKQSQPILKKDKMDKHRIPEGIKEKL